MYLHVCYRSIYLPLYHFDYLFHCHFKTSFILIAKFENYHMLFWSVWPFAIFFSEFKSTLFELFSAHWNSCFFLMRFGKQIWISVNWYSLPQPKQPIIPDGAHFRILSSWCISEPCKMKNENVKARYFLKINQISAKLFHM